MTLIQIAREAMAAKSHDAQQAYKLFINYCDGNSPPRVPGMDTVIRLAIRLHQNNKSIQEAAAAEYIYRWKLAIKTPDQVIGSATRNPAVSIFGAPHTIGL